MLGLRQPEDALLTDAGLHAHRDDYGAAIRALPGEGTMVRTGRSGS